MRLRALFGIFVCVVFFNTISQADTNVGGTLADNTIWDIDGSPYIVTSSVTVAQDSLLTIQPGVEIRFTSGTSMLIAGKLLAIGKPDSIILFTSDAGTAAPGDWNEIEIQSTADMTSRFQYCTMEFGGGGSRGANLFYATGAPSIPLSNDTLRYSAGDGLGVRTASPTITSTVFHDNGNWGIFGDILINSTMDNVVATNNATGGIRIPNNAHPTITNGTIANNDVGIFTGNGAYPLITESDILNNRIGLESIFDGDPTLHNCNIIGNSEYGIYHPGSNMMDARRNYWGDRNGPYNAFYNPAGGGDAVTNTVLFEPFIATQVITDIVSVSGTVSGDVVWDHGMYVVTGDLNVASGAHLTIRPNVVIKVQSYFNFQVQGTLTAVGKADSQIVFTSYKDDSYGGDTNGDGDVTSPAPADWKSIQFRGGSSASELKHVIAKYGGRYYQAGLLQLDNGATPAIDSCFVSRSDRVGIHISHGSSSTISGSYVTGNNGYGIQLVSNSEAVIQNCVVQGSGNSGIRADAGSTPTIVANSTIQDNNGTGISVVRADAAQSITGNTITNNSGNGIYDNNSLSANPANLFISKNVIQDNNLDGLVSSAALIAENTFEGNRYPIAATGRLGNRYQDGGVDGNQFINNRYNNALGLRGDVSIYDTLSTIFPENITSSTYVVEDSDPALNDEYRLVIQSGLVVKFEPGRGMRINGELEAIGQPDSIVFTSWRDAEYGGKTNAVSDTMRPAPGDWKSVYLNNSGASGSSLSYLLFRYGGRYYDYAPIVFSQNTNTISNSTMLYSAYHGVGVSNSDITIQSCVIDTNNQKGVDVTGSDSDVKVLNSFLRANGQTGAYSALEARSSGSFREISGCQILNNAGDGIHSSGSSLPMTIVGNHIDNNGGDGIEIVANAVLPADFDISGNFIRDNGGDGVLSSGATFVDNVITGNRYPISVTGRLGNVYVDDQGEDGNVIRNNRFNNALGLRNESSLSDTLSIDLPDSISSSTYVVVDGDPSVNSGDSLVIDPGVIVKFHDGRSMRINGTLIATGTADPAGKIVFTSWRDATFGGKTNATEDTLAPGSGDWRSVYLNGASASSSELAHLIFRYGGRYYDYAPLVFYNTTQGVRHLNIRYSQYDGIRNYNSTVTIDSSTIDSCRRNGVRLEGNDSDVKVMHSYIADNGTAGSYPGLYADNESSFREISDSEILRNSGGGIYTEHGTLPQTYLNNQIINNGNDGIFNYSRNDAIDSLLTITGNLIEGSTAEGIVSSRAHIKDNILRNNRYPIAVTGQLSLPGTATQNGNVYQNNLFDGNQYTNILGLRGDVNLEGVLGGTFPDTVSSEALAVINNCTVGSGNSLTIFPGTILKFHQDRYLRSDGVITSVGTPDNRIVFTSWKDDAFGGDTNADSGLTVPAPGDWRYVSAENSGSNDTEFRQCIIRFGGRSNTNSLYINSTTADVDTCFISFSSYAGFGIRNSSGNYSALSLHDNRYGVLFSSNGPLPQIHQSNIYNNSDYGIRNTTTSYVIDATNNYWGDDTGPYHATLNPSGLGNAVTDGVQFIPFLGQQQGPLLGDVSLNGQVTAFDAALILRHLVELDTLSSEQLAVSDVSGNGEVSAYDASMILQYVAGIIIAFPGAGKPVSAEALAQSIIVNPAHVQSGEYVDIPIQIAGSPLVKSLEIQVSGDPEFITGISAVKSDEDEDGILVTREVDGVTKIAYATANLGEKQQDLLRLRVYTKPDLKDKIQTALTFKQFSANEVDLSKTFDQVSIELIGTPSTFELTQNYPNPFNPTTTIRYQLAAPSRVMLTIYDLRGKEIRKLVDSQQQAGYYSILWDGKDRAGSQVASGMYFYRIATTPSGEGKAFRSVKKMTVIK